ncbi:MAG: hypothetical protein CL808_05345 [Citromicrobium sp.]|nr:hypothetical protein [Citromicrobium sp.]
MERGTTEHAESSMVLLAIFVSRFEAVAVAAMLRGYGLHVSLDGEAHASVQYVSLALGGHRMRVMRDDYEVASEILRQAGVDDRAFEPQGPSRPLVWLVGLLAGVYAITLLPAVIAGAMPLTSLLYIPLGIYSVPVDPKGRPDYFLAETFG